MQHWSIVAFTPTAETQVSISGSGLLHTYQWLRHLHFDVRGTLTYVVPYTWNKNKYCVHWFLQWTRIDTQWSYEQTVNAMRTIWITECLLKVFRDHVDHFSTNLFSFTWSWDSNPLCTRFITQSCFNLWVGNIERVCTVMLIIIGGTVITLYRFCVFWKEKFAMSYLPLFWSINKKHIYISVLSQIFMTSWIWSK